MHDMQNIPRIDPRRPYVIGPSGLKRIILGAETGMRDPMQVSHHDESRVALRTNKETTATVLVVVHSDRGALDEHGKQAIAAAALLANAETAVVVAIMGTCNDDLSVLGADKIITYPSLDVTRYSPETTVEALRQLWGEIHPVRMYLPDTGADAEIGRRFAAIHRKTIATDVVEINQTEVRRWIPGNRFAVAKLTDVVMLAKNAVDTKLPWVGKGEVVESPTVNSVSERVRDLGISASAPENVALEEADAIVSGGNGMKDMSTFKALADAMGAATGASRVAVDDGRFPRAKQVGATGKTVQSSMYMAIGISGAVQHLQGIKDCRHVIAVNIDESAPIVKRASLTVIEDSSSFMKAMLELVNDAKKVAGKE
ncbi:electron transfer flavoprotein subunit alpha/FixB family protein [Leeia sp. TBRC 13508]|uniref:Electron transfer flavoprotein subunit alpha/FixB family protein n=1 Tax=Leeia speluncae TaxID=2884804 RepID=A0ABS8DAZ6_9NEIS|nr:electron transfer flavoprotein subunit alpha/FixB family protein [Leeia speluncae]MCB6185173.1 electron transfer flavoprotein subunit alpha/FixB family protein [Leeia speluncae]